MSPKSDLRTELAAAEPGRRQAARDRIRRAVDQAGGDQERAAQDLGLETWEVAHWLAVAELPGSHTPARPESGAKDTSIVPTEPPPQARQRPSSRSLPSSAELARASGYPFDRSGPARAGSPFDDFGPEYRQPLTAPVPGPPAIDEKPPAPRGLPLARSPRPAEPRLTLPGVAAAGTPRPHAPRATQLPLPDLRDPQSAAPRRLALILHAHLPWVLGHGTWPHGEDWLMEAVVHCYVPLVAMLQRRQAEGQRRLLTFSITPVLAAQLADPRCREAVDRYYGERLGAAEALQEVHPLGHWWNLELTASRAAWDAIDGNLIAALRSLETAGVIELSTCAATHAYLPLTHHQEMIRLQVVAACTQHERLFGRRPRGIWMPECAYRPTGAWRHPVTDARETLRWGNEAFLQEQGLQWTVVDAHLLLGGEPFLGYGFPWVDDPHAVTAPLPEAAEGEPTLSERLQPTRIGASDVIAFIREPHTARQVWARHLGYPGDPRFLDFHKRHESSGLRLWSVTDADADLADKLPYWPHAAADAVADQARHFLQMLGRIPGLGGGLAACPFDAELFGHWWYEGPRWLEAVFENVSHQLMVETTTPEHEVGRVPQERRHDLMEGSWGEEGDHRVWVNPGTEWMWHDLQRAEAAVDQLVADPAVGEPRRRAALAQLMLMASSDWPFLITMGAAADYATTRFETHRDRLQQLLTHDSSAELPPWVAEDLAGMDLHSDWWARTPQAPEPR